MHLASKGETPVSPWIEGIIVKYGAVLLGVSIGTAAKYGLSMHEGRQITTAEVISDLLLVPFLVLIAAFAGTKLGADPMMMTTLSAFVAISSDRLIRLLRQKFMQRVASEVEMLERHKGEARQLSQIDQSAAHARDEGLNAPTAAKHLIRELDETTR
jgi:hypothetical protein